MAEAEYVSRLVAHLQGKPHELLAHLGSHVPRPKGVPTLGNVLRRHPSIFIMEMAGPAGGKDTVSLVATAGNGRGKGRGSRGRGRGRGIANPTKTANFVVLQSTAPTPAAPAPAPTAAPAPAPTPDASRATIISPVRLDDEFHPNALDTEDVSLISHTHGRARRAERSISRLELQAAVKHGRKEPAHPSAHGLRRWRYTHNGVVYVTDASSRHEITSWRDDGRDLPIDVEEHEPGVYGAHVVMIVDASGSMREADVVGYASRTAAVYECLARDLVEPQGTVGFQSHYGNAVVSLIEMSDRAHVLKQQAPMDQAFADYLRERTTSRARSHGNYLPALDKAAELLAGSRQDARLFLLVLSDGAPSDHVGMPCSHGCYVWSNDTSVRPDGSGKHPLRPCTGCYGVATDGVAVAGGGNSEACRNEVKKELRKQCCERVTQLGVRFGRDRVVIATVAFGDPKGNYKMLAEMASKLPRGSFHKLGVDASALRTAMSSFSSSLTSLRTESAGGNALTLRKVQVASESDAHRASLQVEGSGWQIATNEFGSGTSVRKFEYSVAHQCLREVPMEGIGLAFRITPFAQGAERFVHRGSEVVRKPPELDIAVRVCISGLKSKPEHNGASGGIVGRQGERWQVVLDTGKELALHAENLEPIVIDEPLVRTGHWLVTKQSKYEEKMNDRRFHETFCRMHEEARALSANFNEQLHGRLSAFSIRFVRCSLYEGSMNGRSCMSFLAEQELEGTYLKYNNNAGGFRAVQVRPRVGAAGNSEPLAMIFEEEDDDDDDDDVTEPEPIEAPQCFSHFSFIASGHEKMVCDLQGTWNPTDGYLFTDPVMHHIGLEKRANGATDKGLAGICKFFGSHKCGPLCARLRLPSPERCIELAEAKMESLRLQKWEEEEAQERRRLEEEERQRLQRLQEERQRLLRQEEERVRLLVEEQRRRRREEAEGVHEAWERRRQEYLQREHEEQQQERLRQQQLEQYQQERLRLRRRQQQQQEREEQERLQRQRQEEEQQQGCSIL